MFEGLRTTDTFQRDSLLSSEDDLFDSFSGLKRAFKTEPKDTRRFKQ